MAAGCFLSYPYKLHQDKIVLLKRHAFKVEGNSWGIPGGKLEKGESPKDAIIHEVREETGLNINQSGLMEIGPHYIRTQSDFTFYMFHLSLEEQPPIIISPLEHEEVQELTVSQALGLPLMAAEIESFLYYANIRKQLIYPP